MKQLKDVPIASFSTSSSLNLLRADKMADFADLMNRNYDICIAVSYGKLIPSTFLSSLKYGGLNVHPSLLPKYSGPAPLQRALLNNDKVTGVTVQTLHPTEFDRGDVLLREPYDIRKDETLESLTQELSTKGGMLLRRILEEKIYDTSSATHTVLQPQLPYSYAKKVRSSERQILWNQFSAFDLYRRENTLGPLYTFKEFVPKKKSKASSNFLKRVVLSTCSPTTTALLETDKSVPNGTFRVGEHNQLEVKVHDGFVSYSEIKTEGYGIENGTKFVNSLKKKFGALDAKFTTVLD